MTHKRPFLIPTTLLAFLIVLLTAGSLAAQTSVNLRGGPGTQFEVVGTVAPGETIAVIGRDTSSTWVKVQGSFEQQGWLSASYVSGVVISSLPVVGGTVTGTVTTSTSNSSGLNPQPVLIGNTAVIDTFALNVRRGPSVAHEVLTIVNLGQTVSVLGRNSNSSWIKIQAPSGLQGWVNASFTLPNNYDISTLDVLPFEAPMPKAIINTSFLNLRSGPGVEFTVITPITGGTIVDILGRDSNGIWIKVRTPNGTVGWINASFTLPNIFIDSLDVTN